MFLMVYCAFTVLLLIYVQVFHIFNCSFQLHRCSKQSIFLCVYGVLGILNRVESLMVFVLVSL